MFAIRFLKNGAKLAEGSAVTLAAARERGDQGYGDADQAVIVRLKIDGSKEYVEVRQIQRLSASG